MNRYTVWLAAGLTMALAACSGGEQPQSQAQETSQSQVQPQPSSSSSSSSSTMAQSNPHANVQGMTQTEPAQQPTQASSSDRYQLPKNGKVVKAMHAAGYTYMQVENSGKEFWIAATMLNVKKDDHVRWADAAVMRNFTSSTLHKTFDEILFVTNAELDQ